MRQLPPTPCNFTELMLSAAYPVLTGRECQVFCLVISGKSDPVIAQLLSIGPRTVSSHVGNIFAKLSVNSRVLAAAEATYTVVLQHLGLLPPRPRGEGK